MLVYSKGENFAYHQEEKQTATTTTITTTKAATKVAAGSRQLRLICLTIAKCPAGEETNRVPNGAERDRQLDRETVEQRDSWTGRQTDRQTVKHCDKENCKENQKKMQMYSSHAPLFRRDQANMREVASVIFIYHKINVPPPLPSTQFVWAWHWQKVAGNDRQLSSTIHWIYLAIFGAYENHLQLFFLLMFSLLLLLL